MKLVVAETAGFCMGVNRAVAIAQKEAEKSVEKVFTLGELIHNRQVVEELKQTGVEVAAELPKKGTVIIRAHGVAPEIKAELSGYGVNIIDATCPHVLSSQKKIAEYSATGKSVVISGDKEHPEVAGLCGYAKAAVMTADSLCSLKALNLPEQFLFISQTTFSKQLFCQMAAYISAEYPQATVINSICNATELRQKEARELAAANDMLVVVGGKHSANTCRLAEIGRETGSRVIHVETAQELDAYDYSGVFSIGVTAGASTPASAIITVIDFLQNR